MTSPANLTPYLPTQKPEPQSRLRRPGDLLCPEGIIFDALEHVVHRHLFQQHALRDAHPRPARMLIISGRPGVGKTVAATDAALRLKTAVLHVQASSLASENEGGATAALDAAVEEAAIHSKRHQQYVVVIGDDFDLGILSMNAKTGHTINSNLLIQRLQSLADGQDGLAFDGSRIPFLFTGNDFSQIRGSLFRDGRATWYEHVPTPEDISAIATNMLKPRTSDERRLVSKLERRYRGESVAFWAAIASSMRNDFLDALMATGINDPLQVKLEMNRPRSLEPGKLLGYARQHARARRLTFL